MPPIGALAHQSAACLEGFLLPALGRRERRMQLERVNLQVDVAVDPDANDPLVLSPSVNDPVPVRVGVAWTTASLIR